MALRNSELIRAATTRPIELVTENGFGIIRKSEVDEAKPQPGNEFEFLVRGLDGYELEITVEIDQRAVDEVSSRTKGRLMAATSYWIACAERHLADYLWEHDDYPPGAKLRCDRLTPDDIDLARRWRTNGETRSLLL